MMAHARYFPYMTHQNKFCHFMIKHIPEENGENRRRKIVLKVQQRRGN